MEYYTRRMKSQLTILAMAGAILVPAIAQAATPQQVLNSALANVNPSTPAMSMGDLNIRTTDKSYSSKTPSQDIQAQLGLNGRTVPSQGSAEGSLAVKNVQGKAMGMTIPSTDNPATIEWKVVGGEFYARVSKASDAVVNALKMVGVNAASAVGTWVKADVGSLLSLNGSVTSAANVAGVPTSKLGSLNVLTPKALQVLSVEKRWKENSNDMMRLRVRISPTFINNAMNADLAKVDKKAKDAAAQRKAIIAAYSQVRTFASKVQMAVNVNVTKNTISRVETFIKAQEPLKTCKMNKANKQVCSTTGTRITEVRSGFTVQGSSSSPVIAPSNAITIQDLMKAAGK